MQSYTQIRPFIGPTLTVALALIVTAIGYSQAITGGFQFDDYGNLTGLAKITDLDSAFAFVFSGFAGPLGRPLSLATFAAQSSSWPNHADDFLYVNICIHLTNGALVCWHSYLLGSQRHFEQKRAAWLAASTASIWMTLPLLASSSLLVIQRMTTLSATFVLLGLVTYLKARESIEHKPRRSIAGMSAALVIGTFLATLSKENGTLLPTYVLTIEIFWLRPPNNLNARLWKLWKTSFLTAPSVCIITYLIAQLPYSDATIAAREFSGLDRLSTQSIIVLEYLKNSFIPHPRELGPFHDNWFHERPTYSALSVLATAFWIGAVVYAARFRRNYPSLLFGIMWFGAGHILESTTVPLELYFEHRNYLPILGPIFAFTNILSHVKQQRPRKLITLGLIAYTSILAATLYSQCSLWGNPRLAAEIWSLNNPSSTRAALYLMSELEKSGEQVNLPHIAEEFLSRNPNGEMVRLQKIVYDCMTGKVDSTDFQKSAFLSPPYGANYSNWASAIPEKLYSLKKLGLCNRANDNDIITLAEALLNTPQIIASSSATHNLHSILAVIAINSNEFQRAEQHVRMALNSTFSLDAFEVATMLAAHNDDRSRIDELISDALMHAPLDPFKKKHWEERFLTIVKRADESIGRGTSTSFP